MEQKNQKNIEKAKDFENFTKLVIGGNGKSTYLSIQNCLKICYQSEEAQESFQIHPMAQQR